MLSASPLIRNLHLTMDPSTKILKLSSRCLLRPYWKKILQTVKVLSIWLPITKTQVELSTSSLSITTRGMASHPHQSTSNWAGRISKLTFTPMKLMLNQWFWMWLKRTMRSGLICVRTWLRAPSPSPFTTSSTRSSISSALITVAIWWLLTQATGRPRASSPGRTSLPTTVSERERYSFNQISF